MAPQGVKAELKRGGREGLLQGHVGRGRGGGCGGLRPPAQDGPSIPLGPALASASSCWNDCSSLTPRTPPEGSLYKADVFPPWLPPTSSLEMQGLSLVLWFSQPASASLTSNPPPQLTHAAPGDPLTPPPPPAEVTACSLSTPRPVTKPLAPGSLCAHSLLLSTACRCAHGQYAGVP